MGVREEVMVEREILNQPRVPGRRATLFGALPNIPVGATFATFKEMYYSGLHNSIQSGISGTFRRGREGSAMMVTIVCRLGEGWGRGVDRTEWEAGQSGYGRRLRLRRRGRTDRQRPQGHPEHRSDLHPRQRRPKVTLLRYKDISSVTSQLSGSATRRASPFESSEATSSNAPSTHHRPDIDTMVSSSFRPSFHPSLSTVFFRSLPHHHHAGRDGSLRLQGHRILLHPSGETSTRLVGTRRGRRTTQLRHQVRVLRLPCQGGTQVGRRGRGRIRIRTRGSRPPQITLALHLPPQLTPTDSSLRLHPAHSVHRHRTNSSATAAPCRPRHSITSSATTAPRRPRYPPRHQGRAQRRCRLSRRRRSSTLCSLEHNSHPQPTLPDPQESPPTPGAQHYCHGRRSPARETTATHSTAHLHCSAYPQVRSPLPSTRRHQDRAGHREHLPQPRTGCHRSSTPATRLCSAIPALGTRPTRPSRHATPPAATSPSHFLPPPTSQPPPTDLPTPTCPSRARLPGRSPTSLRLPAALQLPATPRLSICPQSPPNLSHHSPAAASLGRCSVGTASRLVIS